MTDRVYDKKCPICGKMFCPAPLHAYKVKRVNVCSWGCVRKYEKEKEAKNAKICNKSEA